MLNRGLFSSVFVFLVAVDQATKIFAFAGFGSFLNILRPVIGYQTFPNYHFAFSLPLPSFIMYAIYLILLVSLVAWYARLPIKDNATTFSVILIMAGALSNIFDRITLGYVRDFIFIFWGNIFNIADVYIIAGIIGLLKAKQ